MPAVSTGPEGAIPWWECKKPVHQRKGTWSQVNPCIWHQGCQIETVRKWDFQGTHVQHCKGHQWQWVIWDDRLCSVAPQYCVIVKAHKDDGISNYLHHPLTPARNMIMANIAALIGRIWKYHFHMQHICNTYACVQLRLLKHQARLRWQAILAYQLVPAALLKSV